MRSPVCRRLLLLPLFAAAVSAQSVSSAFATDIEGWSAVNSSYTGHLVLPPSSMLPNWDGTEGQPAGSLRIGDVFGETSVRAPAAFLGDKLACFGGTLEWDILIRTTDGATYPAVWLVGASKTLVYNTPSPPLSTWHHASVALLETGWRVNGWQGVPATRGDLMEVLGDLRGLLINTEWNTGPDDTNVDNVVLSAPTTGALCYGAACLGSNGRWPTTWLQGTVTAGANVALELTDGVPNSLAVAIVGFGAANVPVFGCTAWIDPSPTAFVLTLDAAGKVAMAAQVPLFAPGPLGTLQTVFFDSLAPNGNGLALSNAVTLTVQ